MLPEKPTLADFQKYLIDKCKERGFKNAERASLFAHFLEEAGELASAARKFEKGKMEKGEIELEAADVFIFLIHIANHYGINLEDAFRKKEEINHKRSWN